MQNYPDFFKKFRKRVILLMYNSTAEICFAQIVFTNIIDSINGGITKTFLNLLLFCQSLSTVSQESNLG